MAYRHIADGTFITAAPGPKDSKIQNVKQLTSLDLAAGIGVELRATPHDRWTRYAHRQWIDVMLREHTIGDRDFSQVAPNGITTWLEF